MAGRVGPELLRPSEADAVAQEVSRSETCRRCEQTNGPRSSSAPLLLLPTTRKARWRPARAVRFPCASRSSENSMEVERALHACQAFRRRAGLRRSRAVLLRAL